MALGERLFRRYSEEQLGLLLEFTREGRELNEREAAKLEARMRGSESPRRWSAGCTRAMHWRAVQR